MFGKIQTVIKQHVHPFVLLGASLAAVLLLTAFAGIWHHNYELSHQTQKSSEVAAEKLAVMGAVDTPTLSQDIAVSTDTAPTGQKTPSPNAAKALQNAQPAQNPAATNPPQAPAPTTITVKLSVNDTYKGDVTLLQTSNQCDVLQKALESGVISSLDMRYSSQYKTYAVYAIEGQGDSAAIWWTYTLNGKSPPYGCSGTKVASNDLVNWKYVKK